MKTILLTLILCASASAQIAGPPFAFIKSGAVAFSPLSIDSCFVWYDASDSTTITHTSQRVSSWRDKSPNMRDATQSTSGKQPLLVYNAINTKPAVYFLQSRGDELRADSLTYKSHTMTAFAVGTLESSADAYGRVVCMATTTTEDYNSPSRAAIIVRNNGLAAVNAYRVSALSSAGVSYSTPMVMTSAFNGTNHAMRIDGISGITASSSGLFDVVSPSGVLVIGNSTSPSGIWQGRISEVIIYKRSLTSGEISQVETYLKNKWGTP